MGGSSKQTVGYRYFMDLLMGFGRGSCDAFRKIRIGGRDAWSGNVTDNAVIRIDKPDLFGGEDGMGGVVGDLHIQMGEPTQQRNPLIVAAFGPLTSAMRGACTGFFTGQIAAMNPTPEEWEVQRTTILKGWDGAVWYPEKATVTPDGLDVPAMNGVHVLMKVLTHRDCGRGLSPLRIDLDSYVAAADTLHAEGFGLCLRWNRQVSVLEFLQQVCDHIGASQFVNRTTGKLTIALARGGYNVDDLPLFTFDDGLVEIEEDDNPSGWGATNEVIVEWHDPEANKTRQSRWQNLAAIQAYGRVSETIRYPGIPTAKLAARLAQRDGEIRSSGAKRFTVVLDQRGYEIEPAGLFRVSAPEHGIEQIVLRASDIRVEQQTSGRIRILAVQDVFGLEATTYVAEQQSTHQEPDRTPQAATVRQLAELTYRDMAVALGAADVAAVEPTMSGLMMLARRPSTMSLNYQLASRIGSNAFEVKTTGDWCPNAQLVDVITETDTVVEVTAGSDLHLVELGESVRIDNEICRVDAKDLVAGTITIARGCVDTVPAPHAAGARLWFPDSGACVDPTDYLTDTVSAKVLTRTSTGVLPADVAPTDTIALGARQARPYPPARIRVNGLVSPAAVEGQANVTWAHRDRLLQMDQLVDNEAASIGPEPGTTYRVRFYNDMTNALLSNQTGIAGNSASYAHPVDITMRVEVESVRDGLVSLQKQVRRFPFIAANTDPHWANVISLLHFNGPDGSTAITDAKGRAWTAHGPAQISTDQSLFGGSSLQLAGPGGYLSCADSDDFHFTGDFTIDCFVTLTAAGGGVIIGQWAADAAMRSFLFYVESDRIGLALYASGQALFNGPNIPLALNTPYHVEVSRTGSSIYMFVNGQGGLSGTSSSALQNSPAPIEIGTHSGGTSSQLTGFIEEMRITKGIGRHTAPFDPPVKEFPES